MWECCSFAVSSYSFCNILNCIDDRKSERNPENLDAKQMQICAIIWEIIISVYILFKSTFYLDYCASVFAVIYALAVHI